MQDVINFGSYYWSVADDCIGEWNARLNVICDRFGESHVIPALKATYQKLGHLVPAVMARFSPSWQRRLSENWYDPFSSCSILKITKVIERISLWKAKHQPQIGPIADQPGMVVYLNTTLTSAAQHLHRFVKEVNFFLKLPSTFRYYATAPSFDRFISKLPNFFGKSWIVISKIVIGAKYLTLSFANMVLKVLEIAFGIFSLDGLFYLIKYTREVIEAGSNKLSLKFTEVAHDVINRREEAVRKELTVDIANTVSAFTVSIMNRVVAKSVIGGAVFLGAKVALQSGFGLSSIPINFLGASILGTILWKTVLKPTWDPYYHSYDAKFDHNQSYLKEFCRRFSITYLYPSLKTIQIYNREAPEETLQYLQQHTATSG
ncbi:MAG: hypothetical protein JSS30_07340 [Verrucomicrobia bacterium]|nr:hypothetical protein [Verrucomicrobiota bacterium]